MPHVKKFTQNWYKVSISADIVCVAKGEEEAYGVYSESKAVLHAGGFNLRKFVTNLQYLQDRIVHSVVSSERNGPACSEKMYAKATLGNMQKVMSKFLEFIGMLRLTDSFSLLMK